MHPPEWVPWDSNPTTFGLSVEGRFRSCPLTTGDRCNETSELDLGTDLDYPFRGEPEEANRAGGIAVHQGEETVNQ